MSGSSCGGDDDAESDDDDDDDDDGSFNLVENYEHIERRRRQTSSQLRETHKGLKILNNGTKTLDHLLSIEKNDRFGLGFQGKSFKDEDVIILAGKAEVIAKSATRPEVKVSAGNATNGKTVVKITTYVKNITATSTAISTISGKLYDLKIASQQKIWHVFHHCGVVGTLGQFNHGGFELRNTWFRRFDHYGDGEIGFHPHFGGYGSSY
ncbi:hypothetical protein N665_2958s0002 [Sinapis alba]|nr:hypothetical protein N665_2958s0002 [Sinapis alba]